MLKEQVAESETQEVTLHGEAPILLGTYETGIHRPLSQLDKLAGVWAANNVPDQELRRALDLATEVFGDRDKAMFWLQDRNLQTGNRPPVSILGTPSGLQIVETVLGQIKYGMIG